MLQASLFDGLSFDPFSVQQDGLPPSEVDVSRGQVAQALVIALMIVVGDEGPSLAFGEGARCPATTYRCLGPHHKTFDEPTSVLSARVPAS